MWQTPFLRLAECLAQNPEDLVDLATLFLDRGAHPGSQDDRGCPLLSRLGDNYAHMRFAMLIDRGADVELRDLTGRTPLSWAAQRLSLDQAIILLAQGADANSMDTLHRNPLAWSFPGFREREATKEWILWRLKQKELMNLLIEHGADPFSLTRAGETMLFLAAFHRNIPACLVLMGHPRIGQSEDGVRLITKVIDLGQWNVAKHMILSEYHKLDSQEKEAMKTSMLEKRDLGEIFELMVPLYRRLDSW